MNRTLDSVGNGDRLCILGNLNGRIRDRTRAGITGAFGVPGKKYTTVARDQDGVKIKSMIDLVLVKRNMLRNVQDVRAVRGMGRGLSDHHVVLCKVRLV